MDINIYDEVNMENQNSIEKTFMNFALFPMSWSEKWIQGVHFLGGLTDTEWETLKNGGKLDTAVLTQKEDDIRAMHGKGYQPIDQRMIQMYSWGKAMMQFNRYIPSMYKLMFGERDINKYGVETVGTYRAVYDMVKKATNGSLSPQKFVEYYHGLKDGEKKQVRTALASLGAVSILGAINVFADNTEVDKLISDSHLIMDWERIESKLTPKPYAMVTDLAG